MDRYQRQLMLPLISKDGQEKLLKSRVLIVGLGGLGSPLSMYLAGAGIGNLGIMDSDIVSLSNLHRQILYNEDEIGKPKLDIAVKRLQSMNKNINIIGYSRLTAENAKDIIDKYDIVVDACDNCNTRYLINDFCRQLNKIYVYGGVQGLTGQVSIFGYDNGDGRRLWYDDIYPYSEQLSDIKVDKAIIGPTAGVIASIQATEVIKIICGSGNILNHKLLQMDLDSMSFNIINL